MRSVAIEAGAALAPVASRPGGLLTACRRLLARRPGDGPLLWLAATALAASDQPSALGGAVDRLRSDLTGERAAIALPDGYEAQWVSADGSTIELVLWSGALAREGVTAAPPRATRPKL